uniref:Uncharacterized protein n=1 Tax=Anguilla anguilla TaxID=7936 RepID=A0A0E9QPQ2_ANGAN
MVLFSCLLFFCSHLVIPSHRGHFLFWQILICVLNCTKVSAKD